MGEDVERDLACPVCGQAMEVKTIGGVEIDACGQHGMWLGSGELERIRLNQYKAGSTRRQRKMAAMRQKSRIEGWFWGLISLGRE